MARTPAARCAACGKASFATEAAARGAANAIARSGGHRRMRAYHCRDGHVWHLTDEVRGKRGKPRPRRKPRLRR